MRKTMNSHKSSREKLKNFENWPIYEKHAIFAIELSHEQVAKVNRKNTQDKNFEKFI